MPSAPVDPAVFSAVLGVATAAVTGRLGVSRKCTRVSSRTRQSSCSLTFNIPAATSSGKSEHSSKTSRRRMSTGFAIMKFITSSWRSPSFPSYDQQIGACCLDIVYAMWYRVVVRLRLRARQAVAAGRARRLNRQRSTSTDFADSASIEKSI
eukprot:353096-Pleurochrysis_carterae.AAC.1